MKPTYTLKHYLSTILLFFTTFLFQAQVGIGTTLPTNQLDVKVPGTGSDGINIQNDNFNTQLLTEGNNTFAINNASIDGSYNFRFANTTRFIMTDDLIYPSVNASDNTISGALDIGRFNAHFRRVYTRGIHVNDNDIDGGLRINIGSGGGTAADYNFSDFSFYPLPNNSKDLGRSNNQWRTVFVSGEIRNSVPNSTIDVTIQGVADYQFSEGSFLPLANGTKDLGLAGNRWRTIFAQNALNTSDRRLKKNITDLPLGMNKISKIKTHTYAFKSDPEEKAHYGVIAQELQKVLPELVYVGDDEQKTLSVNYIELIPILINAVKQQQQVIENQDSKIDNLASAVLEIKAMLIEDQFTKTSSNSKLASKKK